MPDQLAEQIKKLDALRHMEDSAALEEFDEETEQLILQRFGEATSHLEAYELAMMGEAETIVNMPQSAQEDATQDLFHKGIEQRRQVLEGCLADLADAAARMVTPRAAPPPAPKKTAPRPAKKTRKARPARRAAGKPRKKAPAGKKKPAARKRTAGPAKRKKPKRK